jgi:hypothetical protein
MSIDMNQLKPGMSVRDNQGERVGAVHSTQSAYLKLERDAQGESHWIALAMIDRIDTDVHLNVDKAEVERVWTTDHPNDPEDVIDA